MAETGKLKSYIVRDFTQKNPAAERLEAILKKTTEYQSFDLSKSDTSSDEWQAILQQSETAYAFVDSSAAEQLAPPTAPSLVQFILLEEKEKQMVERENLRGWRRCSSRLNLNAFSVSDLVRFLQLHFQIETQPGLAYLLEKGAEVFYEKIMARSELGYRVDKCLAQIEKNKSEFSHQLFNLRQLLFSVLHQSLETSSSLAKIAPAVDFQISTTKDRIAFCSTFNAKKGFAQQVLLELEENKNQVWLQAFQSCDLIYITECSATRQVEIKALIQKEGNYDLHANRSVLSRTIVKFQTNEKDSISQKQIKLSSVESIPLDAPQSANAEGEVSTAADGTQLNYKLKAGLLENEKSALKGLVKKKNQLITEMNKDINRAQRDVIAAKNDSLKELRLMRLEMEKAQRESFEAKEKLRYYQRKEEEEKNEANGATDSEPKRDFEKELKMSEIAHRQIEEKYEILTKKFDHLEETSQKQRKDLEASKAEANELKNKVLQFSKAQRAEAIVREKETENTSKDSNGESTTERFRDLQKTLAESQRSEQELDKEVKRLTLKVENTEQSAKSQTSAAEKKLESAERQLEETRKKLTEIAKQFEGQRGESKKSTDEQKSKEREQKVKIDNLTVKLAEAEKQLNHLRKKTEEQQKKITELQTSLSAESAKKKAS